MKLRYLLDTNICIYIAKQKPKSILQRFENMQVGEVAMSIITHGELMYGAEKSQSAEQSVAKLAELALLIPPLPLPLTASQHYAQTRAYLAKKGTPIGNNDLWIAAHALALNLILVTNNQSEFSRVEQLLTENWI